MLVSFKYIYCYLTPSPPPNSAKLNQAEHNLSCAEFYEPFLNVIYCRGWYDRWLSRLPSHLPSDSSLAVQQQI